MGSSCDGVEYQRLASLWIGAERDPTPLWWKDGSRIAVVMPPEGIYIVDVRGSDVSIFPPGSPVGNCKDQGPFRPLFRRTVPVSLTLWQRGVAGRR